MKSGETNHFQTQEPSFLYSFFIFIIFYYVFVCYVIYSGIWFFYYKVEIVSDDWQFLTVSLLIQCLPVKIAGDLKVNYNPPILSLTQGCKLSQAYSNHYYWQTAIVLRLNQSETRSQTHQPITSETVKRLANWLDIGFLL